MKYTRRGMLEFLYKSRPKTFTSVQRSISWATGVLNQRQEYIPENFTQFVRCHLEFAVSAWAPWTAQDIEVLEKVQHRAVNQISGLQGLTYEEKLKNLVILSLRARQIRTDLIQTYKILQGLDNVDSRKWFKTVGNGVTRLTRQTAYPGNF